MSEFHQSQEMEGSGPFAFLKDQASVARCSAGLLVKPKEFSKLDSGPDWKYPGYVAKERTAA